ncbi:MAG: helix-turn-helix domain-containing protein [Actinomycetota bacterium]|nr:helix-turn-helix domain-containing protein [Actinomycetota bacterium]
MKASGWPLQAEDFAGGVRSEKRVGPEAPTPPPALLLTAEEAARLLAIGRTALYALLGTGELSSVQLGRRRRVRVSDLEAFVASLPIGSGHTPRVGSVHRSTLEQSGEDGERSSARRRPRS